MVKKTHSVVLLHGIRTQAEWAQKTAAILETDAAIRAVPIRYQFFDLLRFLIPISTFRSPPIQRVTKLIRDELSRNPTHLSVVAHSFGTYILAKILENESDIKFHRVILCGSIISDSFEWEKYAHRISDDSDGDWKIVNDCGMRDILPVIAKSVTWGYGSSGRFGFGHPRVKDRFFDIGHSDYFKEEFVKKNWLPFLSNGRVVEGVLDRATNPWWVSMLTVFKLKYITILIIFALLFSKILPEPLGQRNLSLFFYGELNRINEMAPFRDRLENQGWVIENGQLGAGDRHANARGINVVRYFHSDDKLLAETLAGAVARSQPPNGAGAGLTTEFAENFDVPKLTFEIWISN